MIAFRTIATTIAAVLTFAAGCGADDAPGRAYELRLRTDDSGDTYSYIAEDELDIRVGDEVTFQMHNTGDLPHDLQVVDPSGAAIGVAPPVVSGDTLSLTVTFEEAGFYRLNCLVDDHLTEHSMQAIVEVNEPDG